MKILCSLIESCPSTNDSSFIVACFVICVTFCLTSIVADMTLQLACFS